MLITNVEIESHMNMRVTTDEQKEYIVDLNSDKLRDDHRFDKIREDFNHFYDDYTWDEHSIWWDPEECISIDEIVDINA